MPIKNNNRADRGSNRKAGNAPAETLKEKQDRLAKELRIKPRTRAMVDKLIDNPSMSQTQAYIETHETNSRSNAAIQASKILKKDNVKIYKDSAVAKAKSRIVTLVDSPNDNIALKASQDILDRTQGKAIQRNERESSTVHVSLDLNGTRLGNHYVQATVSPSDALIDQ